MLMNAASRFHFEPVSFEPLLQPDKKQGNQRHHQTLPYQRPEHNHRQQSQRPNQSFIRIPSTFHPREQTKVHQHFSEQQQRLAEMTGNEVNAWSVHQGGSSSRQSTSSSNDWAQQSQEFIENAENFPVSFFFPYRQIWEDSNK